MEIKINGIFDKYNNTVDLDKMCNIFIGENGVGKSTTMKIVKTILSGDFVELLKYYFKSMEISDNSNTSIIIKYEDLFPKVEDILEITKNFECNSKDKQQIKDIQYTKNTIYEYYNDLVNFVNGNTNNYIHLLRTVINEEDCFSYEGFKRQYEIAKDISDDAIHNACYVLLNFYLRIVKVSKFNKINYIENADFANKNYYKIINSIIEKYNNVFLISSVKEFNIYNDIYKMENKSFIKNSEYRILDSYKKLEKQLLKKVSKNIKNSDKFEKESLLLHKEEQIELLHELFEKYGLETVINNSIIENPYKDYDVYLDLSGKYSNKSQKGIDLQKLLFKNYYSDEVIMKFNKEYYTMLKKMVNKEYTEEELNIDFCFENVYNKVLYFIKPLIPRHSFYNKALYNLDSNSYEYKVFNKFIYDNLDYYVNYETDEIKKLNILLGKYFKNKKIYCSPNGLIISNDKDFNNRYNINYLSEGETRIIILLVLLVINDNDVLLIDEPETSLSIIWQKNLIKDILDNGKFKHLIVSTQSPFIVDDDKLLDYVVCLPGGDSNE